MPSLLAAVKLAALWDHLPFSQAQFTLALVAGVLLLLATTNLATDVILIGAVIVLMGAGILEPRQALAGMSNEGMLTVAVLFIVGAGVQQTGGVDWIAARLFGRPKSLGSALVRLVFPTMLLSGFMNNTPLVAMLIPAVDDLCRRERFSPSKLMIPLSFAAILGGCCTLIGTSTNLVVQSQLITEETRQQILLDEGKTLPAGEQAVHRLSMFDISWVGVPAALVGAVYVIFAAKYILPDRKAALSTEDDPREYTVEMQVPKNSPLDGKTIEAAGLRHLPGLFLSEIDRSGATLPAVAPQEVLRSGDRLLFVGNVASVVELQRIRGLEPATDEVKKLAAPRPQRCLIEAVVSNTCPFLGMTIRDARFRNHYNAVVVAVARNGERLAQRIGDIVLHPGDVLLVEAHPSFAEQQRNSRDFFLVSKVENSHPPRHELALIAVGLLMLLVALMTFEVVPTVLAGLLVAGLMIALRCVSIDDARKSINWEVLLSIAASFALGQALETTGAALGVVQAALSLAGDHPWLVLAVVYFATVFITELITNNAAAALMFPFALAAANQLEVSYLPFTIAVMMGASHGYATPIGYQTNLMVYGPGGYKFIDYVKVGLPLDLLMGAVTIALAPVMFPFGGGK